MLELSDELADDDPMVRLERARELASDVEAGC